MARPIRNLDRVQFAALRQQIDAMFNSLHDDLEESYYGDRAGDETFVTGTGWRNGQSKPFLTLFDVEATPEESKALFDQLHGAIWWAYAVVFHEENQKQAEPIHADKYDTVFDESGVSVGSNVANIKALLNDLGVSSPQMANALKAWATDNGFDLSIV